jgi:hypothetical protein
VFAIGKNRVVKGYINFIENAISTRVPFMFNPAQVRRSHGWDHNAEPVPGRSHPMYSGGAGTEESFSMTLVLDADRGTLERRRSNNSILGNVEDFIARVNTPDPLPLSSVEDLRPLLDKFMQFTMPGEQKGSISGSYGVPRRALISLGSVLGGTREIGIDDVAETITKYGSQLNVLKATLSIDAHVVERLNVTNRTLVRRSQRLDRDLPDVDNDERLNSLPGVRD